jgi:hypothetical protein
MTVGGRVGPLARGAIVAAALLWTPPAARAYTVKQTSNGAVVRWFSNDVSMRIDPSMQQYFKDIPVEQVVTLSAHAWHGLNGVPELLISEGEPGPAGYQTGKGDRGNGVYLVKEWELQDNALAVTVATFETRTGKIVDADVLVNANHPLVLLPDGPDMRAEGFDLYGVMTHEMGHVLGLGESYDVRMATMFPSVAPGETHQRDIDQDDKDGVNDAYSHAIPADAETAGCGGSSVVARRGKAHGAPFWFVLGAGLLTAGLWLRQRRKADGKRAGVPALALVVLFGASVPGAEPASSERVEVLRTLALRRLPYAQRRAGLLQAVRSDSYEVRLAAAAVLERSGTRDDLPLAARLSLDSDTEVRRVARQAAERLRTAPPSTRVAASELGSQRRLRHLLSGARRVVRGEAVSMGVEDRNGLLWSRYLVHGEDDVVEVKIPGGSAGDITQIVSEQEPPQDGDVLVVGLRDKGQHSWAQVRDGVVYGGALGEGPGIEWEP